MDKLVRLSVILPVYNKFDCIEYCIKSLLNQGVNDIATAIFVDDGSTDATLSILKKYEDLYPNFIKVISKRNGGVSSARNVGIETAVGEWLLFVDPDDFLAPNTLSKILNKYSEEDVDIIRFGVKLTDGYGSLNEPLAGDDEILFRGSAKDYVLNYDITTSVAHLIRRNVFSDLRYDEDLAYWEDLLLMYKLFLRDENTKVLRISLPGYYYVNNPVSVTNTWASTACMKRVKCTFALMEKMQKLRKDYVWDSNISKVIANKNTFLFSVLLANILRLGSPSCQEIGWIRDRYKSLNKSLAYSKNIRTRLLSALMCFPITVICYLISIYGKLKYRK